MTILVEWEKIIKRGLDREVIAQRVAKELKDGMYINLGVGIPALVADFISPDKEVIIECENGILGVGVFAEEGKGHPDLINALGQMTTIIPGASFADSATSFVMIRGRHLDLAILGAYQVSEKGDLANWTTSDEHTGSIGGAMDLAIGCKQVFVAMDHVVYKSGEPRIVKKCSYPLTARGVVNTIFTNIAVIDVAPGGLVLREVAPGISPEEVQALTESKLTLSPGIKEIDLL